VSGLRIERERERAHQKNNMNERGKVIKRDGNKIK
jgi:hypothetical protein